VLVVIDPLFRAIDFKEDSKYAEAIDKMEPIERIARSTGAHILMTQHRQRLRRARRPGRAAGAHGRRPRRAAGTQLA
jgi:hypothetical protein